MTLPNTIRFAPLWLVAMAFITCCKADADWPQMYGPNRDGHSPEKGLAAQWPKEGPKVLWTFPLGAGYGSPSVQGNEVYVLDRVDNKLDVLRCLDLNSGKELWHFENVAPGEISHNGSRTAPTIDAKNVYAVSLLGDFYCVDRKTHKLVWRKNLTQDFGLGVPTWGITQAPALYKDLVIVAPQAKDAYVVAYKKDNGEIVWKSPSPNRVGYSTPVIVTLGGVEQVVMLGASPKEATSLGIVDGISLKDGKILWSYDNYHCYIPIPYPTVLPDDRLFITGGYKAGSALIQVKQDAGKWTVKEIFKTDKTIGSQCQQPLFIGQHLYLNSHENGREDGLLCMALDGKVLWKTSSTVGLPRFDKGSLLEADGRIYMIDGGKGTLHLIEPSPAGYKELASATLLSGKEIWAPMALTQGKLLIRDQRQMKCIDIKNP